MSRLLLCPSHYHRPVRFLMPGPELTSPLNSLSEHTLLNFPGKKKPDSQAGKRLRVPGKQHLGHSARRSPHAQFREPCMALSAHSRSPLLQADGRGGAGFHPAYLERREMTRPLGDRQKSKPVWERQRPGKNKSPTKLLFSHLLPQSQTACSLPSVP